MVLVLRLELSFSLPLHGQPTARGSQPIDIIKPFVSVDRASRDDPFIWVNFVVLEGVAGGIPGVG